MQSIFESVLQCYSQNGDSVNNDNDDYWLTHWGLVTPFGDRDLGHHWLRWWLVAWRHQAATWTNVDLSSVWSSDIYV